MTTYTFVHESANQNDETIEVLPENFQDVIDDNYISIELDHDFLVSLLESGFDPEAAALIIESSIDCASNVPDYISASISVDDLTEWLELDETEVNKFRDAGFDAADAKKLLDNSIVYDDIPEFLMNQSVNDVIEWIEVKNKHRFSDDVLEAAFNLDIEPEYIYDAYLGEYKSMGDYGEQFYEACYGRDSLGSIQNFVDWDAYGESLSVVEYNDHYFRTDY